MDSVQGTRALPRVGFPIRKSRDQRLVSISPGLIAAAHVLHRLLAPRHPPCALVLLISKNTLCCRYGVFKVHADPCPPNTRRTTLAGHWPERHGLSKLNSVRRVELDIDSRLNPVIGRRSREIDINEPGAYRSKSSGIPRKEVIQPQLPLRLPCYDFTPIIDPTFDGCLPCGLAHRLRVLPTFVV